MCIVCWYNTYNAIVYMTGTGTIYCCGHPLSNNQSSVATGALQHGAGLGNMMLSRAESRAILELPPRLKVGGGGASSTLKSRLGIE